MPTSKAIQDNERWLLGFYRLSELNGALFFGRVARTVRGPLQKDLTHHFADESSHAAYWSRCMADMDMPTIRLGRSYQDNYLDAVGLPSSLMEIMAITHVFEKRAIHIYRRHMRQPDVKPAITGTIDRIMLDERWHVSYVREALDAMSKQIGGQVVAGTVTRFAAADREVYGRILTEYAERMDFLREASPDGGLADEDDVQAIYLPEDSDA
jgi:hypothetical protein